MRSPSSEPNEQEQRAAMMRRLGIVDDGAPPEPTGPRLKVVAPEPQASEAASYEQQLEDMLSRFGLAERPAEPPRPVLEPVFVRAVEASDEPAAPPPTPEPRRRADRAAPIADEAPRPRQTQEEMLEELRRQFKGGHMASPSPIPAIAIPTPTKAQKRRLMGEMGYTKLVIWLAVIGICGWLTYVVVKASVEHDKARAQPAAVRAG